MYGIIRRRCYLMILVAINSGFGMQYTVLIPVFAKNMLHSGASGYGFLMAAQGLGAVAGAIAMNSRRLDATRIAAESGVRDVLHRGRDLRVSEFRPRCRFRCSRKCSSARA